MSIDFSFFLQNLCTDLKPIHVGYNIIHLVSPNAQVDIQFRIEFITRHGYNQQTVSSIDTGSQCN